MYERDSHTGRQTDGHRMTDNAALAQHRAANRPNGNKTTKISVKNFRESLSTVVRAQNDTAKTANITYRGLPFSIEHWYWYSPYKRQRFENRSDQTFCILLIKDVLSLNLHSVTRPIAYYYYYYYYLRQ